MTTYEYIWMDSENEFRSKTKISNTFLQFQDLPLWNYDGSSTGQASSDNSEIILKPVCMCMDPFRKHGMLVLCATYTIDDKPLNNNFYDYAVNVYEKYKSQKPWFGLEQEYFIFDKLSGGPDTKDLLKFRYPTLKNGGIDAMYSYPDGSFNIIKYDKHYCGVSGVLYREIAEKHMEYCIIAGLLICGINAEVAPGQWEFQIGPTDNLTVSNHLLLARYILCRVAEKYNCFISFHPKPFLTESGKPNFNGSGCHINVSTEIMRNKDGLNEIMKAINKLSLNHTEHMECYGKDNLMRLTGLNETSSYNDFTFGARNRNVSIRIPNDTIKNNCGYFEDRRPASNVNPYLATSKILETINIQIIDTINDDFEFINNKTNNNKINKNDDIINKNDKKQDIINNTRVSEKIHNTDYFI